MSQTCLHHQVFDQSESELEALRELTNQRASDRKTSECERFSTGFQTCLHFCAAKKQKKVEKSEKKQNPSKGNLFRIENDQNDQEYVNKSEIRKRREREG